MEKADARLVSVELDEVDELALVDELPFRALSISDRLSEPSPLVSVELISWLAIWSNGELEVELDVVEDELEPLS